jgi:hypothetical protein
LLEKESFKKIILLSKQANAKGGKRFQTNHFNLQLHQAHVQTIFELVSVIDMCVFVYSKLYTDADILFMEAIKIVHLIKSIYKRSKLPVP